MSDQLPPELADELAEVEADLIDGLETDLEAGLADLTRQALRDALGDIDSARYTLGVRLAQAALGGHVLGSSAQPSVRTLAKLVETDLDDMGATTGTLVAAYVCSAAVAEAAELVDLDERVLYAFALTLADLVDEVLETEYDEVEDEAEVELVTPAGLVLVALGRLSDEYLEAPE